jgi:WD40 repeat protein
LTPAGFCKQGRVRIERPGFRGTAKGLPRALPTGSAAAIRVPEIHTRRYGFPRVSFPPGYELTPVARICDVETGQTLLTLTRPPGDRRVPGDIGAVAFARDGRTLVTAGPDRADIWDAESGALLHTLRREPARERGAIEEIGSVAFFPDGNRIVTVVTTRGGGIGTVKAHIWDVNARRLIGTIGGDGKDAIDDAVVLNNDVIATGNRDGTIGIWDATTRTVSATLIAVGQSDFIVLRSDGTYDLSDGARGALHLVDGNEWAPITPEYEAAHRRGATR